MKYTNRIRAYFESFRVKIFLIIVSIMTALALVTTISMYLMATKSLMNQAATITETNMKLEISVVNSIFHSVEYYAKEMAVSEELRKLCSIDDQWDYQTAAEKYRQVKTFAEQKMTSLERNNLINSNITMAIYIINQKTVFDIKSTFYENVKSENISFLKDYEERLDHWVSTPRVNGVNLYPSGMTEKYPETMVSKCFPIMDESGKKIGVLAAQVNSEVFENYFSNTQKGLSGETIVIDETGLPVLYSNRRLYEHFSECLDENLEMRSRWKTIKLGAEEYMLIQGDVENIRAKLFIFIPMQDILFNISVLTKFLLLICFIVLLVSILCTAIISRYFYRPIGVLKSNMHQVKDGNLSVTIAETRKDDFQDIYDTFNDMTCRLEQLIQTVAEERTLNESAELRLLQEQLNPHFLYNTLDSIYSIAKIHKEDQIAEIVAAMSRFFRVSLSNGKNIVTMAEAADIARSYLIIQKIRFGNRINYSIEIEEGLAKVQVPKLLLQPIVENSIYHGIERKKGGGTIQIRISFLDEFCCIKVADDGIGMETEQLEEIKKQLYSDEVCQYFAVRNLAKQLRILYKGKERFRIDSKIGEGTCVTILLPVTMEGEDDKTVGG